MFSLSRITPNRVAVLMLIAFLLLVQTVYAAGTVGTVSVSKAFVSPTGSATITVDDADLNVLTAASQTIGAQTFTVGSAVFINLADTNGDTGTNFGTSSAATGDELSGTPTVTATAGQLSSSNFVVTVFNKKKGHILVQTNATGTATIDLFYNLATIGTVTVDVTSPS